MEEQNYANEIAFSQPVINIGSDAGNDIILRGNGIADFHAMLSYQDNEWNLLPLGDSCKTTVNGLSVSGAGTVIRDGAQINIGDYRLKFSSNGMDTDMVIQQNGSSSIDISDNFQSSGDGNILLSLSGTAPTEAAPGSSVEFSLTVTNAGPLVANMQLQVLGVPEAWVRIIPPVINLNEGKRGDITVRISPPRDPSATAGIYQLHFVAISPNYPRETGTADAVLNILPYSQFLVNGPDPRQIQISRTHSNETAELVVINQSNAPATFVVRASDNSNDLVFDYRKSDDRMTQGQDMVTVKPGDSSRVSMNITSRKLPVIGFLNRHVHYYANVTPSDHPEEAQSVLGEVIVRPMIHFFALLLILLLLGVAALFIFQPRINLFDGSSGKQVEVIIAGNSAVLRWNVSPFASKITLDDGTGPQNISRTGTQYVTPKGSTTYTLTSENFISRLLNIPYSRQVKVLLIPKRPTINVFSTDMDKAYYNQAVTLNWSVGTDAISAGITQNRQKTDLTADTFSGTKQQGYTTDTLFSIVAENDSGMDMRSLFLKVSSEAIKLKKFVAWVRPNGYAVPENGGVSNMTRWGSLVLNTPSGTVLPTAAPSQSSSLRPASVNAQPAAQSNVLVIPDDSVSYGTASSSQNPEQLSGSGLNGVPVVTYYITSTPDPSGLLVSPNFNPTPTPTTAPTVSYPFTSVGSVAAPVTSPEVSGNGEFTIKLAEIVEDSTNPNGYRVIQYFPNYLLQKSEQVLIEWEVEGVNRVKIDNLSANDLSAKGMDYVYPSQTTNYVLSAEVGTLKQAYTLPLYVVGDDNNSSQNSGAQCDLKVNATTLTVPGTVMVSWTNAGDYRVQLVSSAKAEADTEKEEAKKAQEAKEKGQSYTTPANLAMTGGIIGDYLSSSGFMRVNVDKQTTFILNAYDGNGNVTCTKSQTVNYTGGNDKLNLKLAITRIADTNNVSQTVYALGQTIQYTVALTDYQKGKIPTGNIVITDGTSSCSVTWPVSTCSFAAKKTGNLTLTAVYAGDNTYNMAQARAYEKVINKLDTATTISSAAKTASNLADIVAALTYDEKTADSYGISPTGTITFTVGSGTCNLDIKTYTLTCDGTAKKVDGNYSITNMLLTDPTAATVKAVYNGDSYFNASSSQTFPFTTIPTQLALSNAYRKTGGRVNFEAHLGWNPDAANGKTPDGTITFKIGSDSCVFNIASGKFTSCADDSTAVSLAMVDGRYTWTVENLLLSNGNNSDRIDSAVYSGNAMFKSSTSDICLFTTVGTSLEITDRSKNASGAMTFTAELSWTDEPPVENMKPEGMITFSTGSGSPICILTIADDEVEFKDCAGDAEDITDYSTETHKRIFKITDLKLGDGTAVDLKGVYSGDGTFLTSTSETVTFDKSDTALKINKAYKNETTLANVVLDLSWYTDKYPDSIPTGTLTLKIGADNCALNLESSSFSCSGEKTSVTKSAVTDNGDGTKKITWTFENILLSSGNTADRVQAVYSGDGKFNSSNSQSVMFNRINTEIKILTSGITKSDRIFVIAELDWDAAEANGRTPVGTVEINPYKGTTAYPIKYDLATGKLDHDGNHEVIVLKDASDQPQGFKMFFSYLLTDTDDFDHISVKYDGDSVFSISSASVQEFADVNEVTVGISGVTLSEDSAKFDYTVTLSYDQTIYDYWGITPTGSIDLTIGSTACTLAVETGKVKCGDTDMTDAVVTDTTDSGKDVVSYKLTGMPNSDFTNETLTAVYEGDTVYKKSDTASYTYPRVETGIELKGIEEDGSGRFNITVQITYAQKGGNVTKYFPSKTLTYVTKDSGTTCSVTLSPVSGATMSSGCGDADVRINWSAGDTSTWVSVNHLWLPVNDTTFEVTYDGDGRYVGSGPASGKIERKIEMYQKTTNHYLYANLPGIDSAYPMYPQYPTDYSDPAEECRTGSASCVNMKDSVSFSVYIKKSGRSYLPSDAKLTLSGGGLSSTITCTPNNEYSITEAECTFSNVSFSSTGLKNLTVSYSDGSSKYHADDLKLQPIIVVRASLNGAYTKSWFTSVKNSSTSDAYNEGDTIPLGTTVQLTLKITDNNGTDVNQTNYLVYGYNASTHERFNMAQGEYKGSSTNTISLTLNSADIDRIVVEHLGSEATGQRPSVGIFTVNVSGTSGTSSLGSAPVGPIALSPVTLSVELEPLGSED